MLSGGVTVQSVHVIRQLLRVPPVLGDMCVNRRAALSSLMISHSHIPAIADHYSLVCSATPERSAFGQGLCIPHRLHTNIPHPPPQPSFISLHCCLSFCPITLLSCVICEISILHSLPWEARHAINRSVCLMMYTSLSLCLWQR